MARWSWDEFSDELVPSESNAGWHAVGEPVAGVQEWRCNDGRGGLSLTVEAGDDQHEAAWAAIQAHPAYRALNDD